MRLLHRQWASAAIASVGIIAIAACGDDKGVASLEDFYAPSASSSGESSSSGGSSNVTCAIGSTGLLAYLPLDGDARVLGTALRVTDPPSPSAFVSGRFGEALDGAEQLFLETTTSLSLSSWTACAWVRVSSGSNIGLLAATGSSAVNSGIANLSLVQRCSGFGGGVEPYVTNDNIGCLAASDSPVASGTWSFLCIVNDASSEQIAISVDGSSRATASGNAPISMSAGAGLAIGGGPSASNAIDEFSFWSRALSPTDIETLATSRCSGGDVGSP